MLNTYRTNYTTISELLARPLTATPSAARRIEPFTPPVVYNWSLGVQRDIGFNLIADAAYVGNAGRNQLVTVDINGRPYGYAYQPSSLDPTNVVGGQAQPLPDDFLRPYQGFGRIQQREFTGYSDYHALQFAVNRRRSSRRPVGRRLLHLPDRRTRTSARSIRSSRTTAPGTTPRTDGGRTCSCSTTRTRSRT